ncbi:MULTISPECIES: YdiY family protein [Marinobacter]|uniref:DUF481 domain-containing protein n=1 Tax=Marinobacter suaedae TaxID=3057675 RepID=A0ABT8VXN0_9GAMM|nr:MULTISPECIES: DUF481 domain-containing protein [unclassified Marinobacter]MBZ2168815.1 DUF481 domain-containing protein [Marinobacter sp. F4216]MDO3720690.1 DUF481 domain-containing protein [Marinobacter sp. chi1]
MKLKTAVAALLLSVAPLVQAQNNPGLQAEFELGVLVATGNTDERNISGRIGLTREFRRWRNTGEFTARHIEAEDETTAEQYRAQGETNYKFDEQQYWFLRGAWEDDRFSGYAFETSVTAGYGNRIWEVGDVSFLSVSTGLGYRYNRLDEPEPDGTDEEESAIARFAAELAYEISDRSLFRQKLATEVGLEETNTITESETSLQTTVVGNLALKLSYRVKHVSNPPDDAERTDTVTALSVLYTY